MSGKPDFQIPLEPERYELPRRQRTASKSTGANSSNFSAPHLIVGVLKNAHAFRNRALAAA